MPQYDYKITKATEEAAKRRPSIELSPTLEKPIYIVTKNMNGAHILYLIEVLQRQKIQYQLQQETSTLGFVLNQRFFVIVDNKYGEVTLGADFASLLMTIVGYPKIGKNKKNKYFEDPMDIIKYFKDFKASPQLKLSRSTLKCNEKDAVTEEPPSQLKSKIQVRSIIKYKSQDSKSELDSHNSLKQACKRESQKIKLIILEDKSDAEYSSICEFLLSSQRAKDLIEKAENLEEVRKKTLFHTIKIKIFYLVNKKNALELINTIFIGEVIIYSENQGLKLSQMVDEPKIYAVVYQKEQLYKILYKIGLDGMPATSSINSKIDYTSTFNDSKNSPFLLKNESKVKEEKLQFPTSTIQPSKIPSNEVSKIENNISTISVDNPAHEVSELNASVISKASNGSHKIKRLKASKSKNKETSQLKNDKSPTKEQELASQRKKSLKCLEYYQTTSKSKKNLTFKENLVTQSAKIKRVKSIAKVQPEVFNAQAQNCATMTDSEYYTISIPTRLSNTSSSNNFFNRSQGSFCASDKGQRNGRINAFFYRQFVPKFHNIAQIIKLKPSTLFFQNEKNSYMQSFIYMKQYDRFVRRLKNQLKVKSVAFEQYNFIVLLRGQDFSSFLEYCKSKNQSYDDEQNDFGSTLNDNNYSCLSKSTMKMHIYVFIEGEAIDEVISCGRIQIYKHKLLNDLSDFNLSRTLCNIKQQVLAHNHIQTKDNPSG